MTPSDLYQRRLAIGVKQSGLAYLLGVHVLTVSKWERGVVPVPRWMPLALWAIEHNAPAGRPHSHGGHMTESQLKHSHFELGYSAATTLLEQEVQRLQTELHRARVGFSVAIGMLPPALVDQCAAEIDRQLGAGQ